MSSKKKEKREFTVHYNGTWVSTNTLRNNHYRVNEALKRKFRKVYGDLIRKSKCDGGVFKSFEVQIEYRSRLDPDNVSGKFFVDALKDQGVIIDDNKKYFKLWSIRPIEDLKHNDYVIKITEV